MIVFSYTSLLYKWWKFHVIWWNIYVIMIMCMITLFCSCLYWTHNKDHITLINLNIRSFNLSHSCPLTLMTNLIFLILCKRDKFDLCPSCPSTWFVEYLSTDFTIIILRTTLDDTKVLESTCKIHSAVSGQRVVYITITIRITYDTYIKPNVVFLRRVNPIYILLIIFIPMWIRDNSLSMIYKIWSSVYPYNSLCTWMLFDFTKSLTMDNLRIVSLFLIGYHN